MTFDPQSVISPPPAGQPEPSAPVTPAQEPGQEAKPTGLTDETVKQLIRAEFETFRREQQSQRDRLEARVTKSVEGQIRALTAAGVTVTDDMKASLASATRSQIEQETEAQPSEPQAPAPAQKQGEAQPDAPQAPAKPTDPNQPYYDLAADILKEYGISFAEDDPEAAELKNFNGTPRQWLKKVEEMAQAKKARIAAPPQAITPTMTGSGSPGNPWQGMSDLDILSRGHKA